jgi:hypothetical protein
VPKQPRALEKVHFYGIIIEEKKNYTTALKFIDFVGILFAYFLFVLRQRDSLERGVTL